jgi:hypothetical protein
MAYLAATVIFGIGLIVGALVHVSQPAQQPSSYTPSLLASRPSSESGIVGHTTGAVDCVWERAGDSGQGSKAANQKSSIINHKSLLHLGDRLALRSGLLELTYNTGAKVVLQGPVTYEVESVSGGFLSIGKLTARLEKSEVRGPRSGSANHPSEDIHQNFFVRTPTATVTDLGTEFGVEVSADQTANVCVFEGTVEVERIGNSTRGSDSKNDPSVKRRLVAGEGLRLAVSADPKPLPAADIGAQFVRKLPAGHAAAGSDPLEQGLVGYWSFDDASNLGKNLTGGGNLTAHKTASQDPAGLIGGALRVRGDARIASLLFADGQGVPKGIPAGDASYSLSAWCRVGTIPPKATFDIVGWGAAKDGCANALILYGMPQDQCMVRNFWWDNDIPAFVAMASATGSWHHVAATYNHRGRMQYLYLDGVRNSLRAVEQRPNISASGFAVGHRHKGLEPTSPTEWVDGLLDEVGVWNRELSELEIVRLYNKGKGFNPLAHERSAAESRAAEPATQAAKGGETTNKEKK